MELLRLIYVSHLLEYAIPLFSFPRRAVPSCEFYYGQQKNGQLLTIVLFAVSLMPPVKTYGDHCSADLIDIQMNELCTNHLFKESLD